MRKNTISLVLGIVSIFFNPLFILSILAIVFAKKGEEEMHETGDFSDAAQGTIGKILGWVSIVFAIIAIVAFIAITITGSSFVLFNMK